MVYRAEKIIRLATRKCELAYTSIDAFAFSALRQTNCLSGKARVRLANSQNNFVSPCTFGNALTAPQGASKADFGLKTKATATERRRMFVQNVSVIW